VLEAGEVAAFLARVDGEPVATFMLVLTDDVAGVYAMSTVPAHCKTGYGEAVSRTAVGEGRARGATVSILQTSAMGGPVYERMGFEMIGRTGSSSRMAEPDAPRRPSLSVTERCRSVQQSDV